MRDSAGHTILDLIAFNGSQEIWSLVQEWGVNHNWMPSVVECGLAFVEAVENGREKLAHFLVCSVLRVISLSEDFPMRLLIGAAR
jgi:hypothetical protein